MPKNIVIFSDGTGQVGGLRPDQRLSNIYKLYRATRVDPLNRIDPAEQITFYDPGLGTDEDVRGRLRVVRALRRILGAATGRGISYNITDCYEFLINHWQAGDRIWIFGFSRGAYTARCVANVVALCGVPTRESDGSPLRRFRASTRAIAVEAVSRVYEHGAGYPLASFENERNELARRFRLRYASGGEAAPNADPYFIGVFDTVAALGTSGFRRLLLILLVALLAIAAATAAALPLALLSGLAWSGIAGTLALAAALLVPLRFAWKARRTIRDFPEPGQARAHYIRWKADHYDRSLSGRVRYARHAIAIDETRADFPRVIWGRESVIRPKESDRDEPLIQLWFAGNHSDIGGSYPESESRLSDIALQWMIEQATDPDIPFHLAFDRDKLNLYPSAAGMQHCEIEAFKDRYPRLARLVSWKSKPRRRVLGAPLHRSVFERFALAEVSHGGSLRPHRPETLRADGRFAGLYPDASG
ncbi:MAG TPA: DUF2235 domain-containing protein [Sphingopyxis sp.]|nr:DUF2235 domain-containing protein [Sphingopyxis sp.]HMP43856.1 DUF2235 domain-containing protein [Sphingopyxis sp.]HMQ19694.1 DUF2235 domain-containing protein [Sphingopyxis sp.]